ncbi:hypothetical protein HMI55_004954 [Coelomomyces lativittatus]|nr:hypothetical protein HMI55_004954 [Coelomomyces lativittatus]
MHLLDSLTMEKIPNFTHFIALLLPTPGSHPCLHDELGTLQSNFQSYFTYSPFQFCSPTELHLTLCMLELNGPEEIAFASQLLCSIHCPDAIMLRLTHLDSFKKKSNTIHANIDSLGESLDKLTQKILDIYYEAALLQEKKFPKHHVTLLKSYCPDTLQPSPSMVPVFDSIHKKTPLTSWFPIPTLALCKREKIVGPEGTLCYVVESQVDLPF